MELLFREAVSKNDPRPLLALVLTALPNLKSMYAQLPETDIFFTEVLKMAMEGRRSSNYKTRLPLRFLEKARLTSVWKYKDPFPEKEDTYSACDFYKLSLDHLWAIFQLLSIRNLRLFDFEPTGAAAHDEIRSV